MITMLLDKLNPVILRLGNVKITWYAILVIGGAILAYVFTQYLAKKKGFDKDMIEGLFYLVFPIGIVGARIWFVLSNLSGFSGENWYHMFFVWEGGLAIQGGVVAGVITAFIYLLKKYPKVNALDVVDLVLPNVLLAQCIGRWGNFFNQEVYGACVDPSTLSFLPKFILNQMMGGGGIYCPTSQAAQPLFLYEGLLTLLGWVIISIILRKFWNKRPSGILTSLYLVYYGTVRAILEPLRNEAFIMQINGVSTSVVTSIVYVILGVIMFVLCFVFKDKIKNFYAKKELENKPKKTKK